MDAASTYVVALISRHAHKDTGQWSGALCWTRTRLPLLPSVKYGSDY